jgi:catechol 2,3-dioxygenase-like lactoylglutathione lyase family enzyme
MTSEITSKTNVQQAVPFFNVTNLETSLRFYLEGLGFEMTKHWIDEGKLRWCWLQLGGASLMLQEYRPELVPSDKLGAGASICFICEDALKIYHEAVARGLQASKPFVGNAMWVTSLSDPDGYRLDFESYTDVMEGTEYLT